MAKTLLLDVSAWDLVLDIDGDIAVASNPYALAQDAASAIRTFLGEVWYDTTIGVPYDTILGKAPRLSYLKAKMVAAALTVPEVAEAKCFVTGFSSRGVSGQVQVRTTSGQTAAASF